MGRYIRIEGQPASSVHLLRVTWGLRRPEILRVLWGLFVSKRERKKKMLESPARRAAWAVRRILWVFGRWHWSHSIINPIHSTRLGRDDTIYQGRI